jgi:glucose-1-phosphate thymidylyltransferase
MRDQVVEYTQTEFGDRFECHFVEQESAEGLGHSIYQSESVVGDESIVIALGDMLFRQEYREFLAAHGSFDGIDASIGVKQVDEPQHYGVVEKRGGRVVSLVEKPDNPPSSLAISGVYVVEDSRSLFDALCHLIENDIRGAGDEFQLTDALARMLDGGAEMATFEVEDWYDCGRPATLLEANRVLLDMRDSTDTHDTKSAVVVEPVDIGDDVDLEGSVVGPHVSVDDGSTIRHSIVRNAIVGRNSTLSAVNLEGSLVGDNATVSDSANNLNIGDNCTVDL